MKPLWRFPVTMMGLFLFITAAFAEPYDARVTAPVADLRGEPSEPGPSRDHDPLEESQLLYGDPVRVLEEKDGWARVEAVRQQEWSHNKRWQGYPGWMRLSDLTPVQPRVTPEGGSPADEQEAGLRRAAKAALTEWPKATRPTARSESEDGGSTRRRQDPRPIGLREAVVRTARGFLGTPYYWGGRSFFDPAAKPPPHRGVDCSGLTGLAYQMNGVSIPRDAHEQWMKALEIRHDQLEPADLIFLSDPNDPKKITHVMLYAGGGSVIEGPGTGETVREINLETRLKEAEAAGRRVYHGSYFSDHGSTSSP